jgi:hypothetical protein
LHYYRRENRSRRRLLGKLSLETEPLGDQKGLQTIDPNVVKLASSVLAPGFARLQVPAIGRLLSLAAANHVELP